MELAARQDGGFVEIEVRDRGTGIPEEDRERIFEKFYRSGTRATDGAGLGLAICRAIAQAHKGEIAALPRDGGGSIFRVRIPAEPAP